MEFNTGFRPNFIDQSAGNSQEMDLAEMMMDVRIMGNEIPLPNIEETEIKKLPAVVAKVADEGSRHTKDIVTSVYKNGYLATGAEDGKIKVGNRERMRDCDYNVKSKTSDILVIVLAQAL